MTRPTDPNISIPSAFAINGTKTDFTNEKIQDGFDDTNPDILAGDNLNKFIDDTYKGLNDSMDGVDDLYDVTDDLKDLSNLSANGQAIIDNKASKDLNNLSATGEAHFANPDLSNLSNNGNNRLHALKGYLDNGTALTDAEGLADVVNYAHSTFDLSKFTVVGSPTITDDGIASGFGSSNYITLNPYLTSTNYKLSFSFGYNLSTQGYMIDGDIKLYSNGTIMQCIVVIGGVQKTITSTYRFDPNGSHKFDYELSCLNNLWTFKIRQGNSNWSVYTNTFDTGAFGTNCNFGKTAANKVDLKTVSIWNDGVEVFNGNKTGIDTIKPDDYTVVGTPTISADGVASGFSGTSYITIPDLNISGATDFEFITPYFKVGEILSGINQVINWTSASGTQFFVIKRYNNNHFEYRISQSGTVIGVTKGIIAEANKFYQIKFVYKNQKWDTYHREKGGTWTQSQTNVEDVTGVTITGSRPIGWQNSSQYLQNGSIDLNSFKIYVDGNLVYQPCLKIPYTQSASKYGSKIVNAVYRSRVQDAWEQNFPQRYYTLDEANGNFTLPQGEIYGMMLNQSVPHVIESYNNSSSWYRVWSDGWCEQGGGVYIAGSSGGTVTLLKAYKDINYSILLSNSNYLTDSTPGVIPGSKHTTVFTVDYPDADAASDVYWETRGYIS